MGDYLIWVVEKFITKNFPDAYVCDTALLNDVQDLIMNHSKYLSDEYSPKAYLKETEGK